MAVKQLGKFLMREFTGWSGLTDDNHLASIFGRAPQLVSDFMILLLALYRGKSLESELSKYATKYFDTDDEYVWQVIGSSRRNIPLIEARDYSGAVIGSGAMAGVGNEPFYLVFAEEWFGDGEVLFGNLNEVYPVRIIGDPVVEGSNVVYKVVPHGAAAAAGDGIPGKRLQAGERFSQEYSPVSRELSRKVGTVRFQTPVTMRNEWSTIRKLFKVPGSTMLNKKLACGVPLVNPNTGETKVENMWMAWVEWQYEMEWSDEKNSIMMFGTSNRNSRAEYTEIDHKTGRAITQGDGLLQQMKYGNTTYYNDFSLKLLENALYELSAAKLDYGQRTFVIRTGEQCLVVSADFARSYSNVA